MQFLDSSTFLPGALGPSCPDSGVTDPKEQDYLRLLSACLHTHLWVFPVRCGAETIMNLLPCSWDTCRLQATHCVAPVPPKVNLRPQILT